MLYASFVALAGVAAAWGGPGGWPGHHGQRCINDSEAAQVGTNFGLLVSNYSNTLANTVLASTFTDQTDSVITLIDSASQPQKPIPLGSLTFPSKQAYETLSAKQPPVPFQVMNTWHNCDTVIIRWISHQTPQQVQGFTAMQVVPNTNRTDNQQYPFLINTTYGEFNSGAWLVNLGNPQCS